MTHLDGRTINLKRRGTTQPGEVEVVEGEGVRHNLFLLSSGEADEKDASIPGCTRWRYVHRILGSDTD